MSKTELKKLTTAVIPAAPTEELPQRAWSPEKLVAYSASAFERANVMARRTAIEAWLAGRALMLAYEKTNRGEWIPLLKAHSIPRSTANELIRLAKRVRSKKVLENLTVAEAMKISGIRRDKKETARASAAAGTALSENDPEDTDDEDEGGDDQAGDDEPDDETEDSADDESQEYESDDSDESDPDADQDYEEGDEEEEEDQEEDDESDNESPVTAISDVVRRLSGVEQLLDAEGLGDEDSDAFLEALDDAENALKRIRKAAAPRPPRAAAKSNRRSS